MIRSWDIAKTYLTFINFEEQIWKPIKKKEPVPCATTHHTINRSVGVYTSRADGKEERKYGTPHASAVITSLICVHVECLSYEWARVLTTHISQSVMISYWWVIVEQLTLRRKILNGNFRKLVSERLSIPIIVIQYDLTVCSEKEFRQKLYC